MPAKRASPSVGNVWSSAEAYTQLWWRCTIPLEIRYVNVIVEWPFWILFVMLFFYDSEQITGVFFSVLLAKPS